MKLIKCQLLAQLNELKEQFMIDSNYHDMDDEVIQNIVSFIQENQGNPEQINHFVKSIISIIQQYDLRYIFSQISSNQRRILADCIVNNYPSEMYCPDWIQERNLL